MRKRVSKSTKVASSSNFNNDIVEVTSLQPTKEVGLEIYNEWRYIPDCKFSRELFGQLYVSPQAGVSPSRRKRDLHRFFRLSLMMMWNPMQNAQVLAQAS